MFFSLSYSPQEKCQKISIALAAAFGKDPELSLANFDTPRCSVFCKLQRSVADTLHLAGDLFRKPRAHASVDDGTRFALVQGRKQTDLAKPNKVMKMTKTKQAIGLAAVLTGTAALNALGDQSMPAAGAEKNYTGEIISVDPQEHMLRVKSWMLSKKEFNLGDNCAYELWGINNGAAGDLRPGQKITVCYQDSHGVQIADRVEQHPMQFDGMVAAIDPGKHMLTLHQRGLDQQLMIADGCSVALRGGKSGALADIQPGEHVTVTYETPNGTTEVRQIAQTSIAFTGKLTAIDLDQKTVKAKDTFGTMRFNLANDCTIVVNGKTDGKLGQLRPNDRLVFNYDSINGVNIVNRIAPAPAEDQRNSLSTTTPVYPGVPVGY